MHPNAQVRWVAQEGVSLLPISRLRSILHGGYETDSTQVISHFPGNEREAYQLFDEIIQSAPQRFAPTALRSLSYLSRPHAQDADQQRLNPEIWDRLAAAIANPDKAQSAASAITLRLGRVF